MEKIEKFIPRERPESKEELPSNVVVETPEAKFRIAYGLHPVEMKPEVLGKSDALMIETGVVFNYTLPKKLVEKNFNRDIRRSTQYGKIIEKAEREEKPIFLGDITEWRTAFLLQIGLKVLELTVGIALLKNLIKSLLENEKMTRREFLKKTAAGIYLSSEMPSYISLLLSGDEKSAGRAIEKFLTDLNERTHPETNAILLTLRNYVMAQKLKTIAEKLGIKNRKPEVAIAIGKRHSGIEKALEKEDEERVRLVNKLLSIPGLKKTRENIATIAQFDFNEKENKWELTDQFKDPYLSKIEK